MVSAQHASKKDVVTEFRRTTILDAACRAFARCGYGGTTVDTIAAEAKIAKGTVYLYYKSKADVYHAAVTHGLQGLYADTERALTRDCSCREKIEQFIRLRFEYLERHHDFYRIYLSEFGDALSRPSRIQKQMREMSRRQTELLESVIARAISKGEIRPMPVATAARAIYDVTRGLLQSRLLGWVDVDQNADVQSVLDLLWNGLRPTT
jgi:AcrR family transcriptional regulator